MNERIDPAEIGALIDGELPSQRAAQVRGAIERDAELRAGFESMSRLHARWVADAESAAFAPDVRAVRCAPITIKGSGAGWMLAVVVVLLLILLRFGSKLLPLTFNLTLHALGLGLIVLLVLWLLHTGGNPGLRRLRPGV